MHLIKRLKVDDYYKALSLLYDGDSGASSSSSESDESSQDVDVNLDALKVFLSIALMTTS